MNSNSVYVITNAARDKFFVEGEGDDALDVDRISSALWCATFFDSAADARSQIFAADGTRLLYPKSQDTMAYFVKCADEVRAFMPVAMVVRIDPVFVEEDFPDSTF